MKKLALVFVLAVLAPSLVLAWLALHSLRDQQFLLERQQTLLYQHVTDAIGTEITTYLSTQQQSFSEQAERLAAALDPHTFDQQLCARWPLAEVGFCVTLTGQILAPELNARPLAQMFRQDNSSFLGNRAPAELYWNVGTKTSSQTLSQNQVQNRSVSPQNSLSQLAAPDSRLAQTNLSKVAPAAAEFSQLIGDSRDGMLARFLQNQLKLMFWHRSERAPELIFGAQLSLERVVAGLRPLIQPDETLRAEICIALLNDSGRPAVVSRPGFTAIWKHPFVASEIGEALPHWEVAAYLIDPARLTNTARTAKLTLGLLIGVLVLAIGAGSWLIVRSLNLELKLARQKTDFVSNVSHELKTPLTSIRMFSELLAEGRVSDPAKQQSYLQIISAEASRLTRLINNVLDFSRLQSGAQPYHFQPCDLAEIVRATAETFRPHLAAAGFQFDCACPDGALIVPGDADALAQIIVNLLSNAEKYSTTQKEIQLTLERTSESAEIYVLDRGSGVPRGSEEKVFEKFYRAHDSLSSGLPGSGLGLTIARHIARAHGGEIFYTPRPGGGSCFCLRLPLPKTSA